MTAKRNTHALKAQFISKLSTFLLLKLFHPQTHQANAEGIVRREEQKDYIVVVW